MDFDVRLTLLLGTAFLVPIVYAWWIRDTERCHRQQWASIFICFLWGASLAIIAAFILEFGLEISLFASLQNAETVSLLMVIVIAPIVEEFAKPLILGARSVRSQLTELEDGLIYGAVAGLGFSATENLFYGLDNLTPDLGAFFLLIAIRSFGACLLHASATALTGYGYGKTLLKKTSLLLVLPYYALAIILHSSYNLLVSLDVTGTAIGLGTALLVVALTISLVRGKIKTLDQQNCEI